MAALMLVSGGAGFTGSHLVDALLLRDDRVRVLDDLSTGQHLNPAAEPVNGDVADPEVVARAERSVEPRFTESRAGDVRRTWADIGSARKALGYRALVRMEDRVARTVAWFHDRLAPAGPVGREARQ